MAQLHPSTITISSFLLIITVAAAAGENYGFVQSVKPAPKARKEKLSHFRLYWHDVLSGKDPTSIQVAQAATTNTSKTFFGMVRIMDNSLTEGPDPSSKVVGRSQGFYASAAKDEVGLLMAMNLIFMVGKYNGSSVTVMGRNSVFSEVREMPVIGGGGLFRFARGYCKIHTRWFDPKTGDATVEYNVYVIHY